MPVAVPRGTLLAILSNKIILGSGPGSRSPGLPHCSQKWFQSDWTSPMWDEFQVKTGIRDCSRVLFLQTVWMRLCQICLAQPTSPTLSQQALCPCTSPQVLAQAIPRTLLSSYYKNTIQCPSLSKRAAVVVAQALRLLSVLWRLKR